MSLEVRQLEVSHKDGECVWKFKLGINSLNQIDFYTEEESVRSLFHLAQDMSHQIQSIVDRKKKKTTPKDRVIRKLCEKILKSLKVTLRVFADDVHFLNTEIQEPLEIVEAFFQKGQMEDEKKNRIMTKCQKWIMEAWMSLPPEHYFKTCRKYLESLFKDGKKTSPDFSLLNEFYLIIEGDKFQVQEDPKNEKTDNMVLIDINLNVEGKYISESFLWDMEQVSSSKIKIFIQHFLPDALFDSGIELTQENSQQLFDDCFIQFRSQLLYKNLLKKHANLLLNFSTIQPLQDAREYLIEIQLNLKNQEGITFFSDSFEWDILNENNSIENFCKTLMQDEGISEEYFSELCYKMKSQINDELHQKFMTIVKTFRLIHKDRQSPKLNTQTQTQLKKNIIYTLNVNLPFNPDTQKLSPLYLNNSDLFSTLSKNIDILPEEFQKILQYKEILGSEKESAEKIKKQEANQVLREKKLLLQDNGYLGTFTNIFKSHSIWQEELYSSK